MQPKDPTIVRSWGLCLSPETPAPAWLAWVRKPMIKQGNRWPGGRRARSALLVVVHGAWERRSGCPRAVVGSSGMEHPPERGCVTRFRAGPRPLMPPHGSQPAGTTSGSGRGALRRPAAAGGLLAPERLLTSGVANLPLSAAFRTLVLRATARRPTRSVVVESLGVHRSWALALSGPPWRLRCWCRGRRAGCGSSTTGAPPAPRARTARPQRSEDGRTDARSGRSTGWQCAAPERRSWFRTVRHANLTCQGPEHGSARLRK